MQKNIPMFVAIVVMIVIGAGAFFGGMKYQQTKTQGRFNANFSNGGQMRQRQGNITANVRNVRGEILNKDDKSITVKLTDGGSKIVLINDKTSVIEATSAAQENLTVGKQVAIMGVENSDGSVTAQNIQLNPILGRGPAGFPNPR